jgi:ribonuclease HI
MILTQEEPPETVVPATIEQDMIGSPIVKVNYSDSKLTPSLTRAAEHPTPSISTQVLDNLGALTPLEEICKAAASGRLILSCDGSYQPDTRQASYSWVFSDGSKICDGSGSIQSSTNNPYRAELYAILVSMIILQHATRSCKVQGGGKVTILSDCQKALRQGLKVGPIGVKEATQDEYDIILNILQIRDEIGIEVALQWVPGHGSYTDVSIEQQLNAAAHQLAIQHLRSNHTNALKVSIQDLPTSQTVMVLYKSLPVTGGLPQQIINNIHYTPLRDKIMKDNNWTEEIFDSVDWSSFHEAILSVPRSHRVLISKLSHGLWNTNMQNRRFYGHSNICPICNCQPETLEHVFRCNAPQAISFRETAAASFKAGLSSAGTPRIIAESLLQGVSFTESTSFKSLLDHVSCQAVVIAQTSLGWVSCLKGHLCKEWQVTFASHLPKNKTSTIQRSQTWMKQVIRSVWHYSKSIWDHRNMVVHSLTTTKAEGKEMLQLKRQAKHFYNTFKTDKYCVPYTGS